MAKEQPKLQGTEHDVKLTLVGANSFNLQGPFEVGQKLSLNLNVIVAASYPELVTTDEGDVTRDHVKMKVTRLTQSK